jgi:hypothetical protein
MAAIDQAAKGYDGMSARLRTGWPLPRKAVVTVQGVALVAIAVFRQNHPWV